MRPSRYSVTNARLTARERSSSSVKRSRLQSTDDPSVRIWPMIVPLLCRAQSQTRASNASRPRSCRDRPSSTSCASTTFCVAMPAWSVPGSHSTSSPFMRRHRAMMSGNVWLSAWPICRRPVTLGGGSTIENGGRPDAGSARNAPIDSQKAYHLESISRWANVFDNSSWDMGALIVSGRRRVAGPSDRDGGRGRGAAWAGASAARPRQPCS